MNRIMVHSSEVCVKAVCFIPASPFTVSSNFTYCSAVFPSLCICTHQLAEKCMLTTEHTDGLTHIKTERAQMANNLLLLLMVVAALSVCRAVRWHNIRFVCRFEGAHPTVHVTSVCVPIWRSTPIGTSLQFVRRSEGAHPSVRVTSICVLIWRSTPIGTSLRFVCRSEGAPPSVHITLVCANLKEHTHQ